VNYVKEFVEIRQQIESLANEIAVLVDRKNIPESKTKLLKAAELLEKLKAMADNDVQEAVVTRLTWLLGKTELKISKLKMPKKTSIKS
jgi:hypothetical protein